MADTYLYILNFLSVSGTDPYESWGSLVEPLALGFRLSATRGDSTNLNTGECSIAQTQNLDTNEKITYIVADVAMEPYAILVANNIFFRSWDEEKTVMKERFGFPTVELNQDITYTTADFSTMLEAGFSTLLEQGTSSELPVATKFSKSNYTLSREITNLNDPKSIIKNPSSTNNQFFNTQRQTTTSSEDSSTTSSTGRSGTSTMGGY
jgi:hypothetical protein